MKLILSRTACKRAVHHGLDAEDIKAVFEQPSVVYPIEDRDGQFIIKRGKVGIIGVYREFDFYGITIFKEKSGA